MMNGRGTLPQPHRYTAGIHQLRALREGINLSSAHPLQPEINSSPGPKDYDIFPGGHLALFPEDRKQGGGYLGLAPNLLCRGLSKRQDCISFPIPGLPSSTLGPGNCLVWLRGSGKAASPSLQQSQAKTGDCPVDSIWHWLWLMPTCLGQ